MLATSKDAPALGGVYKLVDLQSDRGVTYRAKLSADKVTYPGAKQVFRFYDGAGFYSEDIIALENESYPSAMPLLHCVMKKGERLRPSPTLPETRQYAREELTKLAPAYRRLNEPAAYSVAFSEAVKNLLADVRKQLQNGVV